MRPPSLVRDLVIGIARRLVPLSFGTVLLACDSPNVAIDRDSPEWLSSEVGVALEAAIGSSRAELVRRWGTAEAAVLDTTSNRHVAGQIDTTATFLYDGLEAVYYVVSADGRELLTHVHLARSGFLSGLPFDVGSSIDEVIGVLGPPTSETPSELRYEDEYDIILLGRTEARVSSIRYVFYVD